MTTNTTGLPSTVEETLAICPQFRILVVGKSGVGKSSLISCVFNLSLNDIDIAHHRAGRANVEYGYTSNENPRFILHDSKGFEPGDTTRWSIIEHFLLSRSGAVELKDRVHAIWLCIETPRTGARVEHRGDENLVALAGKLEIPLIVVFTKFDLLVNEYAKKADKAALRGITTKKSPEEAAEEDYGKRIESVWIERGIECVRISTELDRFETLRELADVTRKSLRELEGELWVPWAVAQHVSARQKVDESIRVAKEQYWLDLGRSTVFQGHRLINCLNRILRDMVKIWNFNDPKNLLIGDGFVAKTIQLIAEFSPSTSDNDQDDRLSRYSDVASLAAAIGTAFAQVVGGIGIGLLAMKFLYQTYRAVPATAQYLAAYIVDVTLVLHKIFMASIVREPPRILSDEFIDDELQAYSKLEAPHIHHRVREMDQNPTGFEQKIVDLIQESIAVR